MKRDALISFFLAVMTLAFFWQVGGFEFVNYDDDLYVTENLHLQKGFSPEGLRWAFTTTEAANWHPVTWLSLMLDERLFGRNPSGYHLTSLLFHILNTLLLFRALRRMTGDLWPSAFVAALFALHPLHVESVAWVAERKDVLSAFFWMLTMISYLRYTERPATGRYLLVLLVFAIGLMAKPMLVTLPFVLLLLDVWPLGRLNLEALKQRGWLLVGEKIPLLALTLASSVITFLAQQSGGAVSSIERLPFSLRLENALVSYVRYIGKMLWPAKLAPFYPQIENGHPFWQTAGAALFLAAISILVFQMRRARPFLAVGWLWYLGTLVPVIGIVQVGAQAIADRYTYIPLIGLFIMIAWGVPPLLANRPFQKAVLGFSAVVLLSSLAILSWRQAGYWRNSLTLFNHALRATSRNYVAHVNLGTALEKNGNLDEAIVQYTKALQIQPLLDRAHSNLGAALNKKGEFSEAIHHFSIALEITPTLATAHYNLGVTLEEIGQLDEALSHFSKAIESKPNYVEAYNNMGAVLDKKGRSDQAVAQFTKALQLKPDLATAHYNLGIALEKQGKLNEAASHLTEALRIEPGLAMAHYNLGSVLGKLGKLNEATSHFSKAIELKPDLDLAHGNLGVALAVQGKLEEAIPHLTKAIQLKPDYETAHFNLGLVYYKLGRLDQAAEEFETTLRINPTSSAARNLLEKISIERIPRGSDATGLNL